MEIGDAFKIEGCDSEFTVTDKRDKPLTEQEQALVQAEIDEMTRMIVDDFGSMEAFTRAFLSANSED